MLVLLVEYVCVLPHLGEVVGSEIVRLQGCTSRQWPDKAEEFIVCLNWLRRALGSPFASSSQFGMKS